MRSFGWSGVGQASSWATMLGLPVAIVAGIVALQAYRHSVRAARDEHMHGLFRDHLQHYARESDAGAVAGGADASDTATAQRLAERFYVLEEMFEWLQQQWPSAWISWWSWWPVSRHRRDSLNCWRETIVYHLRIQPGAADRLVRDNQYYSRRFILFAAEALDSVALARVPAMRGPPRRSLIRAQRRGARAAAAR